MNVTIGHSDAQGPALARFLRARTPAVFGLILLLATLLAACGEDEGDLAATVPPPPSWIVSVEPEPGERSATFRRVEVNHTVTSDGEGVRLSIDGTDVTSYADFGRPDTAGGPGRLVYDFEQARDFLPLEPGEHTATVSHVRLTGIGSQHEVLDSYSWSFTIQ